MLFTKPTYIRRKCIMKKIANELGERTTTSTTNLAEASPIVKDTTPKEGKALDDGAGPFIAFRTSVEKIREIVVANLGGSTLNAVERIRIPAGGATVWTVPDIAGELNFKELFGVMLVQHSVRRFWKLSIEKSGGAQPPDCYSSDGKRGTGSPGGNCVVCPHAQYGSDPKGGRACKEFRELLFLRPENFLPDIVSLPVTSIKGVQEYLGRLAKKGLACYDVVTKIGLEKTKNDQGIEYARATFTAGQLLPREQAEHAKAYHAMFNSFIDAPSPAALAKAPLGGEGEVI
jgi:hypothetical protein